MNTPEIQYTDRMMLLIKPSWKANPGYLNEEHRRIYEKTQNIPGWQMEGDSYKFFEMGYFSGDTILEIGTYGGRSAVIEVRGALSNPNRKIPPQFYGLDINGSAIKRTYCSLLDYPDLIEHCLLFHGDLKSFASQYSIQPTMVFVDGDHRYNGVKSDLEILTGILIPGVPVFCHDYMHHANDRGEIGVRRALLDMVDSGFFEFFGVFGCSALLVSTSKCKGSSIPPLSPGEFAKLREHTSSDTLIKKDSWPNTLEKSQAMTREKTEVYPKPIDVIINQ